MSIVKTLISRIRKRFMRTIVPFERERDLPRYAPFRSRLFGKDISGPDGRSFYYSYKEIFEKRIYDFNSQNDAPIIVDCGSNIGLSIIFFKLQYPNSKIIGIEADPYIASYAINNLSKFNFNDVTLKNVAIDADFGIVRFASEGADGGRIHDGNMEVREIYEVASWPLDAIIEERIDFLKIDIEGAETAALSTCTKLNLVDRIFVEFHSFVNQPQLLGDLLNILTVNGFRYSIHQQFASARPFTKCELQLNMDLQLNVFAWKNGCGPVLCE
jgi:FkbM family methyltransferase